MLFRSAILAALLAAALLLAAKSSWIEAGACLLGFSGALCNEVAIRANGGRMPVRGQTRETARHRPLDGCRLPLLCDVIPLARRVFSVGDLMLLTAMLAALLSLTRL